VQSADRKPLPPSPSTRPLTHTRNKLTRKDQENKKCTASTNDRSSGAHHGWLVVAQTIFWEATCLWVPRKTHVVLATTEMVEVVVGTGVPTGWHTQCHFAVSLCESRTASWKRMHQTGLCC
jgi:hypothetical protein